VLVDVLAVLHRHRRHAGRLQPVHQRIALLIACPRADARVERVLMLEARGLCRKAHIARPLGIAHHRNQRLPLTLIEHGDRDPAILAGARVDPMRRGVRMLQAIAGREVGAARGALVDGDIEQDRPEQVDPGFDRGDVDLRSLAGRVAAVDRHQ
jgi:hypothetical protein